MFGTWKRRGPLGGRAVLTFAILLAAFTGARSAEPAPIEITIATYNIRHGRGMDNVVDLQRTAAALRALNADVIGLQEVDRDVQRSGRVDEAVALAAQLGMTPAFGAFMPAIVLLQFAAKVGGGFVWSLLLRRLAIAA